jgi:hypothetical protein
MASRVLPARVTDSHRLYREDLEWFLPNLAWTGAGAGVCAMHTGPPSSPSGCGTEQISQGTKPRQGCHRSEQFSV